MTRTDIIQAPASDVILSLRNVWFIGHPFAAGEVREFDKTLPLSAIAAALFPAYPADQIWVQLDGAEVPPSARDIVPAGHARIVMAGLVEGDGFSTAVAAATAFVAKFASKKFVQKLLLTAGQFLINVAINSLLNPPAEDSRSGPELYTLEGARNQIRFRQSLRTIFGTHRVYGDVAVPFVQEISGDDVFIVGAICWAGHGVALSDLKFGETDVDAMVGVEVQHRLREGDPEPTLITGVPTGVPVGLQFSDTNFRTRVTGENAEEIELIFYFPEGLALVSKSNKTKDRKVQLEIEYRPLGEIDWISGAAQTVTEADNSARALSSLVGNRRDLAAQGLVAQALTGVRDGDEPASVALSPLIHRSTRRPFYFTTRFAVPPDGRAYEVRVRRTNDPGVNSRILDEVVWTALNSFAPGDPFPNKKAAVSAFRIKASNELTGVVDTINALVSPRLPTFKKPEGVPAAFEDWTGSETSSNCADLFLFALRGEQRSRPKPADEINIQSLADFHDWCRLNDFTFDFVDSGGRRLGDLLNLIALAGQARVIYDAQGRLGVVIDGPRPNGRKALITARNARDFVTRQTFPAEVHALVMDFINKDLGFGADQIIHYLPGYSKDNATLFERLTVQGVVHADTLRKHGENLVRAERLQTLSGSCVMDREAGVTLEIGDAVGVQVPRFKSTSTAEWAAEPLIENDEVVGFVTKDPVYLKPADQYIVHWRKIGTNEVGQTYFSAQHTAILDIDFPGDAPVTLSEFRFSQPVPDNLAPGPDDLLALGEASSAVIEATIAEITPLDDDSRLYRVDWVSFDPARFEDYVVPAHTPLRPPRDDRRPLTPVIRSITADDDGIYAGFEQTIRTGDVITGFDVRYRRVIIVADGEDVPAPEPWIYLSRLPADARRADFPPGRPGETYDISLRARAKGGNSAWSAGNSRAAADQAPPPENLQAAAIIQSSGKGSLPALQVSVTPPEDPSLLVTLGIETRTAADGDEWKVATTVPSTDPRKTVVNIVPGADHDVRVFWVNNRGAVTPENDRPVIAGIKAADAVASDAVPPGITANTAGNSRILLNNPADGVIKIYESLYAHDGVGASIWFPAALKSWDVPRTDLVTPFFGSFTAPNEDPIYLLWNPESPFQDRYPAADAGVFATAHYDWTAGQWSLFNLSGQMIAYTPNVHDRIWGRFQKRAADNGVTNFERLHTFSDGPGGNRNAELIYRNLLGPTGAITTLNQQVTALDSSVSDNTLVMQNLSGYAAAQRTISVNANGVMTGLSFLSETDGIQTNSNIGLYADALFHRTKNGRIWSSDEQGILLEEVIRVPNGPDPDNPQTLWVWGNGFGADGNLKEWFGPFTPNVNSCTATNGFRAETVSGEFFRGGVMEVQPNYLKAENEVLDIESLGAGDINITVDVSVTLSQLTGAFDPSYYLAHFGVIIETKIGGANWTPLKSVKTFKDTGSAPVGVNRVDFPEYPSKQNPTAFIRGGTSAVLSAVGAGVLYSVRARLFQRNYQGEIPALQPTNNFSAIDEQVMVTVLESIS